MSCVIGVNVGSENVKGALMNPDALATAGYALETSHPAVGWAEQDLTVWCNGVARVVQSLMSIQGLPASVVSHLGLASQFDTANSGGERNEISKLL
jgi:sugar (pentulose or hexulose) kinase